MLRQMRASCCCVRAAPPLSAAMPVPQCEGKDPRCPMTFGLPSPVRPSVDARRHGIGGQSHSSWRFPRATRWRRATILPAYSRIRRSYPGRAPPRLPSPTQPRPPTRTTPLRQSRRTPSTPDLWSPPRRWTTTAPASRRGPFTASLKFDWRTPDAIPLTQPAPRGVNRLSNNGRPGRGDDDRGPALQPQAVIRAAFIAEQSR
jgi:hypothetical protein